ncbi:DEAD/DEAH box helicase [Coralloluteibacterium stylophorae]|nr:DEAD/DEAH box helicase [Coralloluteibacterium stylophorae]
MTPDDLHRRLAEGHWRGDLPESLLQEGRLLAAAGAIHALTAARDDHGPRLLARFERAVHAVGLDDAAGLRARDRGEADVRDVAALLLASALPPDAWSGEAGPLLPPDEEAATGERTLGLLLRMQDTAPLARYGYDDDPLPPRLRVRRDVPRLCVAAVWARPARRDGGLVDPQPASLRPGALAPAEGWPDEVAAALEALAAATPVHQGALTLRAVTTRALEEAMETLAARYPVWYERPGNGPLARGPQTTLALSWQPLADGSQLLVSGLDDYADAQLLRGAGLWYVRSGEPVFGSVGGDLALLDIPPQTAPLQPEDIPGLLQQQKRPGPAAQLPVPEPRGPVRRLGSDPVPVLVMRGVPMPATHPRRLEGDPDVLGCARLAFDYGPLRANVSSATPVLRRFLDGKVVEARRDLPRERKMLQALLKAGLVEARECARGMGLPLEVAEGELFARPDPRRAPLPPEGWRPLLRQLAASGARIEYELDFPHDEMVEVGDWHLDIAEQQGAWFDVRLGIDVQGTRVDMLPLLRRMLEDPDFPLQAPPDEKKNALWRVQVDDYRSVQLPLARLRALIAPLLEWLESDRGRGLRMHRTQAAVIAGISEQARLRWADATGLRQRLLRLREGAHAEADAPPGFNATLRPYQREGLAWLDYLADTGLGGVLADDMGLGKTVQVIAHLLAEKQRGRMDVPALVVCPTSLVGNWREEAARFAPGLRTLVLHGSGRADAFDQIDSHDLVITTYPLLPRDRERLVERRFSVLVMDEAQAIKNARSLAAQVVREIPARRRLAMTGTPLENHLGELWAQFDAVEPGLLGSERQFARLYRTPIEKHGDAAKQQRLNRRIGPLLLRRRKDDVLADLPAKSEMVRSIDLEGDQRALYETLRLAQHARVLDAVSTRGLGQSGIVVIDALLKLRQVCCDPRLVKLDSARHVQGSAKLDALLELVDSLLGEGRSVLVFSQFTEMLALIGQALDARGIAHLKLTGQTPGSERADMVARFQAGAVPLFLISLKAGGVGLNLTAADTVIHYDPWWNPAAEAQATDRAHRIGQDKPVFVYRLICAGTVEEKIQAMQHRKADLARAVLEEGGSTERLRFDEADLAELFEPL